MISTRVIALMDHSIYDRRKYLIDETWLCKKPKWKACLGLPISFAMVWQRKID